MAVPPSIKQENVDYFATDPDLKCQTNMLDLIEIKQEPIKTDPHSYVPEMFGNNDKCMFDSLNKISKQKVSEIKVEGSEEIEKMEDIVDEKIQIKNEELNIKDEFNIEDEEQGIFESQPNQQGSDIKFKGNEEMKIEKMFDFVDVQCKIENDELINIKAEGNNMEQESRFFLNQNIKQEKYIDCLVDQTNNETTHKEIKKVKTTYNSGLDDLKLCPNKITEGVKKYKCDQCDFASFLKISLNKHILEHKTPKEVRKCKFTCDQCDFTTVHKNSLIIHIKQHENGKKFKCSQCEYVTAFKTHFQQHSLRHNTLGKLFRCEQCKYVTNQEDNLNRHLIVHKTLEEGIKLKCSECKFVTQYISSLRNHTIRKHKNPALKM